MDKSGNQDGRVDYLEFARAVELLAGICKREATVVSAAKAASKKTRKVGEHVRAKCDGWTKYYNCEITCLHHDGTYDLTFDDGERKSGVREHQIEGSGGGGGVKVFLGGSCNPTTWRKNIAIPLLNRAGISYFNPQVDEWHDGLVAIEAKNKEEATVLLYVIDGQTRSLASMVEIAEVRKFFFYLLIVLGRHNQVFFVFCFLCVCVLT